MIREATLDDLNFVAPLFDAYRVFYENPSDLNAATVFIRERMERSESVIYVSETTGESTIVGFVQLYPVFSSTRMKRLWLLNDLFVDPAFRGEGHSIALIERAKQLCAETNACGLFLETAKTNIVGRSLYPKAGFTRDQEHDFYSWDAPK